MVDHAVDFDWTESGLMMGQKQHAQLDKEQKKLLYSDLLQQKEEAEVPTSTTPYFASPGWGRRNVVSARTAWARIRLGEDQTAARIATAGPYPVVGNGLLAFPAATTPSDPSPVGGTATSSWVNEEVAETDIALAALSEGTQLYLKSVFEKALFCARQRQNLDGIRLWHQQVANPKQEPELSIRLGCDVSRQVARAAGNAALTVKRMEQALERQDFPSAERVLKGPVLCKATSLSDLALRPKLSKGVEKADLDAKRSYEIYGGKHADEPVLGRVPKRAKLEVVDFALGMELAGSGSFGRPAQRASTLSGSFRF